MDFTQDQHDKLLELGLPPDKVERFRLGGEVAYDFRTESAVGIALLQITEGLLRCGILEINDPGGGLFTFLRFRNGASCAGAVRSLGTTGLVGPCGTHSVRIAWSIAADETVSGRTDLS